MKESNLRYDAYRKYEKRCFTKIEQRAINRTSTTRCLRSFNGKCNEGDAETRYGAPAPRL